MPQMDGIEVVRHLAERDYPGSLILVSGEDERMLQAADRLVQAHHMNLLGHLKKPATTVDFSVLLAQWHPATKDVVRAPKKRYSAGRVRAAIENGELVNYYQPKVTVENGKVNGVETLVRWNHPQDGMVFPDQFITVAEENGLIGDLTCTVLKAALADAKVWMDAGLNLRVAVNLSMNDLADLDFANFASEEAEKSGVPPSSIMLEVTESRLMHQFTTVLDVLTRLRLKRFGLSIDDFGTGHSSLAQLRDLPFDELKIDQSFTRRAWQDDQLRAIFEGSLGIAQQLGMKAVAEGVEDHDDWTFLRKSGCHTAQGYFIARPMPAANLPDWVVSWQSRCEELFAV